MNRLAMTVALLSTLVARSALPCGGGFGAELDIAPEQTIVVVRDGTTETETYIFNPAFCGAATDFGLILPVPAMLSANPALVDAEIITAVEALSEPRRVKECESSGGGCGSSDGMGAGAPGDRNFDPGVNVIDGGQVGIFDWTLLQADTPAAFTDWLDTNGYPYDAAAAPHFDFYVNQQWFFVAFKVTTGTQAPPAGSKLCGTLGPLALEFPATRAVIPARIASINRDESYGANLWRIFTIAPTQMQLGPTDEYGEELYFSGAISAENLSEHPALAAYAQAGDRLTGLTVYFPWEAAQDDIYLQSLPTATDFRTTVTVWEDCGCAAANSRIFPAMLVVALASGLFGSRRRKRA